MEFNGALRRLVLSAATAPPAPAHKTLYSPRVPVNFHSIPVTAPPIFNVTPASVASKANPFLHLDIMANIINNIG
jgi:hypothetical protein